MAAQLHPMNVSHPMESIFKIQEKDAKGSQSLYKKLKRKSYAPDRDL